jgi:phosphoglucomutase
MSRLVAAYYTDKPDPAVAAQRVAFARSGHNGSALHRSFNEAHALSLSQAICDYRTREGIYGPIFVDIDRNALSVLAFATALEVLETNGAEVRVTSNDEQLPMRTVSYAILTYNRGRSDGLADGIVVAAPHERPENGGFTYIPRHGGSPDIHATRWIDTAANEYLRWGPSSVRRREYGEAARGLDCALRSPLRRHAAIEVPGPNKSRASGFAHCRHGVVQHSLRCSCRKRARFSFTRA